MSEQRALGLKASRVGDVFRDPVAQVDAHRIVPDLPRLGLTADCSRPLTLQGGMDGDHLFRKVIVSDGQCAGFAGTNAHLERQEDPAVFGRDRFDSAGSVREVHNAALGSRPDLDPRKLQPREITLPTATHPRVERSECCQDILDGLVGLTLISQPDNTYFLNNRGLLYLQIGQIDLAKLDFEKSIDLKIEDAESYYCLYQVYERIEDYNSALEIINKAIEISPQEHKYLYFRIYFALLENAAGEHSARMIAMESATKNADELINKYTLQRNRARQAAITTELIEIISGSEALK